MPFFTSASSLPATRREACAIFTGKPAEALGEGAEVLAREQRRRHHDRDLLAGIARRRRPRASATSVLPKPTSPQISRSMGRPLREIVEHGVDAGRSGPRSPHRESGRRTRRRGRRAASITGAWRNSRAAAILISFSAMSRMRCLSLRLARLPADAAEPVELGAGLVGAVAASAARYSRPAG